jgi:hypothetical protein
MREQGGCCMAVEDRCALLGRRLCPAFLQGIGVDRMAA